MIRYQEQCLDLQRDSVVVEAEVWRLLCRVYHGAHQEFPCLQMGFDRVQPGNEYSTS